MIHVKQNLSENELTKLAEIIKKTFLIGILVEDKENFTSLTSWALKTWPFECL